MKTLSKIKKIGVLGLLGLMGLIGTVSCSDDPDGENFYTFTGEMMTDYLKNRPQYSEFYEIVNRAGLTNLLSGRLSSKSPNLQNLPATGSVYAKPVKRIFGYPPGYIFVGADQRSLTLGEHSSNRMC